VATDVDVLVVGGGPSGLAAALGAARAGRSVLLVESAQVVGGMAASFTVAGQRVDYGSHRLHPSAAPGVRALLDELLGDDLQVRERRGRLRLADRWVDFPLRTSNLLRTVPWRLGARIGAEMVTGPLRRPADASYGEFVRAGLGPTALARFHGPMATKLWGCPPSELSAELARRRISVDGGGALLRRLARTSRPDGRTFLYPRLGYGQVVDRLAESAAAAGVGLVTSTSVATLTPGSPVEVTTTGGDAVAAARVLWTAGPGALARATGVAVPPLTHRGLVLVNLAVPADRYSPVDAHYVPDPGVPFARLSEPKNYRDGPDPVGVTVLCAELPATVGDGVWRATDTELAEMVLGGMAAVDLPRPAVAEVVVRRLPRVYPVLRVGDADRRRALAPLEALAGVTVLGRQGLHVADNLHHVLDMALSASGCLTIDSGDGDSREGKSRDGAGWDAVRWAAERARFETFVVDD
jgi:protoporphyrinogen oxidase